MVRKLEDIELPAGNYTLSSKLKDIKIEKPLVLDSTSKSPIDYNGYGCVVCFTGCHHYCDK